MNDAIQSTIEALRASQERLRLIADNVGDVIWIVEFPVREFAGELTAAGVTAIVDTILEHLRFSFVSRAVEWVFGYEPNEFLGLSLRDITTPASFAAIRQAMIEDFVENTTGPDGTFQHRFLELEFLAKDGSTRWCEVLSTYLRNGEGTPEGVLGITRDLTGRRQTERDLRESEGRLRSLVENMPEFVLVVDRNANIQFANHGQPGVSREALLGTSGLASVIPEHQEMCRRALELAISSGERQTIEVRDVLGSWWSTCIVALADEKGSGHAMLICTDVTRERLAAEAVKKEQQLLRRLLEIHERERKLIAYDIHDGFAQQLSGAIFRLQSFRETFARDPAEAWQDFDCATRLVCQAIDETRRLISSVRPPVLDELGIVDAIQYVIYEHRRNGGPEIDFDHDMPGGRLPPRLEDTVFRIIQESLQNACRHSRSDTVHVALAQRGDRIHIDVRDWGVGFNVAAVSEQRFGLQSIRERVRLLDGRVVIKSVLAQGTHISVELPLIDQTGDDAEIHQSGEDKLAV